jgi:hypothetical protein
MARCSTVFSLLLAPLLLLSCLTSAHLVLEDFFNGSNPYAKWITDYSGTSGRIGVLRDQDGSFEAISTNVTYCSSAPCYRAELKTPDANRKRILSTTNGEYWIGISIRIPITWQWIPNTGQEITCYIFQIHGGDNMGQSPIIGIRNEGTRFRINICGNTALSSSDSSCQYFSAGNIIPGQWDDWVIYDKFSYDDTSTLTRGIVRVWRNGLLVVDKNNLLTSYNDLAPHYLKFGSYILQWKNPPVANTAVTWVGSDYRAIRVGNSSSSYAEVYTGPRYEPSSSPTLFPTLTSPVSPSSSSSSKNVFMTLYIWILIGGGGGVVIVLLTVLFCCCQSQRSNEKPREVTTRGTGEGGGGGGGGGSTTTRPPSAPSQIEMSSAVVVSSSQGKRAVGAGDYAIVGSHEQAMEERI